MHAELERGSSVHTRGENFDLATVIFDNLLAYDQAHANTFNVLALGALDSTEQLEQLVDFILRKSLTLVSDLYAQKLGLCIVGCQNADGAAAREL